jgi:gliding motility associated protien GldN
MKGLRYLLLVLVVWCVNTLAQAQNCENIKVLGATQLYVADPLPVIDERDVMWHRRLWREIDLKERANQNLYFLKGSNMQCTLYDILYYNLVQGNLKGYDPKDDRFTSELTIDELISMVGDSILNENGELVYQKLESRSVVKYWLKEDWFFDSKYAKVDVRIVGICPVKISLDNKGNILGYKQLFWLYFPNIRSVLVNTEIPKKESSAEERVSFDAIFIDRLFDSYIIQKEGGHRQHVSKHKTELSIKLENEKTKQYFFKREPGLWGN